MIHGVIEIFRDSDGQSFQSVQRYGEGEVIELLSLPGVRVAVSEILR